VVCEHKRHIALSRRDPAILIVEADAGIRRSTPATQRGVVVFTRAGWAEQHRNSRSAISRFQIAHGDDTAETLGEANL
jgi:hypothetical protein